MEREELGGTSAVALRSFAAGELVFRERALVMASAHTNFARLRAHLALPKETREELLERFWSEAPLVRCAATAACRADAANTGDSVAEVFAALRAEGHVVELSEVEAVVRIWNLNAYDCALAPVACKVSHSCAPNVSICVDAEARTIEATACRAIARGDALGTWYFQDTGLWWMGADVRRAIFQTERGFQCGCVRCLGPDPCRAVPCQVCNKGRSVPSTEKAKPGTTTGVVSWQCSACAHSSAGDALRLAAEAEIVPRVLLEIRPPKVPGQAARCGTAEELAALGVSARERLGTDHWAAAAVLLVLHYRGRTGGALDPFCVAAGCRFIGWLVGCSLPWPPASVVRTPVSIALDTSSWLAFPEARSAPSGGADRRCLAARLLTDFLLPVFKASGATVAKVANTGVRVEKLQAWLAELRSTCGKCGKPLAAPASSAGDAGTGDDGKRAVALSCGRCKQLRYCSRACQQADWKERHKSGCLGAGESLASDAAWQMLLAAL